MKPVPFEASAAELDDGVRVIAVRGELDLSTAAEIEGPLEDAIAVTGALVLIDLSECEFIDSTGIALIVRAWQRLNGATDGQEVARLVICSSNDQVRRVLDVTGIELSIPIHGTREEALAALRG